MTPQEALRHFEEHLCKHCCEWDKSLRHCNTCPTDTAKKSLEKQIPKKPICREQGTTVILNGVCPKCSNAVHAYDNYCAFCGQKLNWSDEERK